MADWRDPHIFAKNRKARNIRKESSAGSAIGKYFPNYAEWLSFADYVCTPSGKSTTDTFFLRRTV
jgi:hypothetical protein